MMNLAVIIMLKEQGVENDYISPADFDG